MKQEMYAHLQEIEQTHWWYVARRKIVFDWLSDALVKYSSPNILDVGCGTGFNMEQLRKEGYNRITGLDFSLEALFFCRSRDLTNLVCSDATRPSLREDAFDIIVALDLIEHLDDDVQALCEFTRLLRSNGTLIVFAPAFEFLWGLQDEVSQHRRRYTARELREKLGTAGLQIEKLSYANMFLFPIIWAGRMLLRLSDYEINGVSENDLHPDWSNGLLQTVFLLERPLLRHVNLPIGVSLFCLATPNS
jgi:SAM-dependent methyltransferase